MLCGVAAAPGLVAAPGVAFTSGFAFVLEAPFTPVLVLLLPGVAAVPAWGVVDVPVGAGCVLTALGFAVPLPNCELAPVGLAGSAGVWLVTGVFAIEPFPVCVWLVEGEAADVAFGL